MRSTAKTLAAFSDPAIFVFHCVYTDRPSPPAEYLTVNLDRSKFSSFPFLVSRARKSLFTYTCSSNFLYKRNRNISHFRRIPLLSLDRRNVLYRGYSIIAVMVSVPWTLSRAHLRMWHTFSTKWILVYEYERESKFSKQCVRFHFSTVFDLVFCAKIRKARGSLFHRSKNMQIDFETRSIKFPVFPGEERRNRKEEKRDLVSLPSNPWSNVVLR